MSAILPPPTFRLGATSYVIPGDLVENARYLVQHWQGVIRDMQLVLFDLPGGPGNLPDAATVAELAAIGRTYDLSYTVHLTHDLCPPPREPGARPTAWRAAQDVIARTMPLAPRAYIAHLDAKDLRAEGYAGQEEWQHATAGALRSAAGWAGAAQMVAVENLEGYPPDLVEAPVRIAGAARCVDVGHLWLERRDPLPYLQNATRPRVIHVHGVGFDPARGKWVDHQALDACAPGRVDALLRLLYVQAYAGVVTLEVFGPDDFRRSVAAFRRSWQRVAGRPGPQPHPSQRIEAP